MRHFLVFFADFAEKKMVYVRTIEAARFWYRRICSIDESWENRRFCVWRNERAFPPGLGFC